MEKNFFKIITVFIVMLLCIDNVKAQVGYAELTDNEDLDGNGKTLTFKSDDSKPDGTLPLYTTNGEPSWYSERENITTVVFDPSFANCKPTSCANWFRGMKKLTSISGMKNYLNTENVKFMGAMFCECSALTGELDLSGFNTSSVTDMGHMFYKCSKLTNIKFGENFKTGSVTDMSYMFFECSALTGELDLSSFNTSSVTEMSYMFYDCPQLTNIKFGENFKTGSVTYMGHMFTSCSSLTGELDLSGFNTSNVIYMGALFSGCSQLTNIKFGENFKTGSVKDMGSMFSGCSSLTGELDLSGFNTSSVTDMSYMFANCSQLTNIKFGENFKTGSVTDMHCMFRDCKKITALDLSGFNTESVIYMELMYMYCNNLTSIKVGEDWKTDQVSNSYNMFYDCPALIGNGGAWVGSSKDKTNANTLSTGYLTSGNYKVFLNPDGGTVTGGNVINLTAEETTLPEPTKTGHQFLGWTRQLTSTTFESSTTTLVTVAADEGNKKYKAQWTLMKYPVKFHYDETSVISETSVAYNSLITPAPFPEKDGFKCMSWNPSLTFPISWDFETQTLDDVALTLLESDGALHFYPTWEPIKTADIKILQNSADNPFEIPFVDPDNVTFQDPVPASGKNLVSVQVSNGKFNAQASAAALPGTYKFVSTDELVEVNVTVMGEYSFALGQNAKVKVSAELETLSEDIAHGVWAEKEGGNWYIVTSSTVSDASYTVGGCMVVNVNDYVNTLFEEQVGEDWLRSLSVELVPANDAQPATLKAVVNGVDKTLATDYGTEASLSLELNDALTDDGERDVVVTLGRSSGDILSKTTHKVKIDGTDPQCPYISYLDKDGTTKTLDFGTDETDPPSLTIAVNTHHSYLANDNTGGSGVDWVYDESSPDNNKYNRLYTSPNPFSRVEVMRSKDLAGNTSPKCYLNLSRKELYDVTFTTAYGDAPASQRVFNGDKVSEPDDPTTTEPYDFQYWQTEDNNVYNFDNTVSSSLALTAVWEPKSFTASFYYDETSFISSLSVVYGSTLAPVDSPEKPQNRFLHWAVTKDGETSEVDFETFTMPAGDVSFYAQWEEKQTPPAIHAADGLVYNFAEQTLVAFESPLPEEITFSYKVDGGEYSEALPVGKDAKEYVVWYKSDETENYKPVSESSVAVTISPRPVTPDITLSQTVYIYDGEEKFPEILSVTFEGADLSSDYNEPVYNNNRNVGEATVMITSKTGSNYTFTQSVNFVIVADPFENFFDDTKWYNTDIALKTPENNYGWTLYVPNYIDNTVTKEGENNVKCQILNENDDIIAEESYLIKIDKTAPEIFALADGHNVENSQKYFLRSGAEFSAAAKDNLSGVETLEYSWDNEIFKQYDGKITLPYGKNTVYLRSKDVAGNQSETLKADFSVFEDSKFVLNNSDEITSDTIFYSSKKIHDISFEIDLNGNTIGSVVDSVGNPLNISVTGGVIKIDKNFLETLLPGINRLSVRINPLGDAGAWSQAFAGFDTQTMRINLDVRYAVASKEYSFVLQSDPAVKAFCQGDDVVMTMKFDDRYSDADYFSVETLGIDSGNLDEEIKFRIPVGALSGGNEKLPVKFFKDGYEFDDVLVFPSDYPLERNIKVYEDVLALDNSDGQFTDGKYKWYMDNVELSGVNTQFLDLTKYMTDGQRHVFFASVENVDGDRFRVCPDDSFVIEPFLKKKAAAVKTYPNPAVSSQPVYIELKNFAVEDFSETEILIYNQLGGLVQKVSEVEETTEVVLPFGFYSGAVVVRGQKVLNFKILVE